MSKKPKVVTRWYNFYINVNDIPFVRDKFGYPTEEEAIKNIGSHFCYVGTIRLVFPFKGEQKEVKLDES